MKKKPPVSTEKRALKERLGQILSSLAARYDHNFSQLAQAVDVAPQVMRRWANSRDHVVPSYANLVRVVDIIDSESLKLELTLIILRLRLDPEISAILSSLQSPHGVAGHFEGLNKLADLAEEDKVVGALVRLMDECLERPLAPGVGPATI